VADRIFGNAQDLAEEEAERDRLRTELDDDEISVNVGILAAKTCPTCGGAMRVIQGAFSKK